MSDVSLLEKLEELAEFMADRNLGDVEVVLDKDAFFTALRDVMALRIYVEPSQQNNQPVSEMTMNHASGAKVTIRIRD